MKIGLSTFSLGDPLFLIQLNSMLEQDIRPDFILLHEAGALNRFRKYLRLLTKLIRQERAASFVYLRKLRSQNTSASDTSLSAAEPLSAKASQFLQSARILQVQRMNDASTIRVIRQQAPALIVCNSGILKDEVLQSPGVVFLNVHASRLPAYRGMNNIEWALWEGNAIYASIHQIAREIDEGDMLFQEKLDLGKLQSIAAYRKAAFAQSHALAGKAIKRYLDGKIAFSEQPDKGKPIFQYYSMHPLLKECLERKLKRENH
jgi:methionyl-tRNA formyltransferase